MKHYTRIAGADIGVGELFNKVSGPVQSWNGTELSFIESLPFYVYSPHAQDSINKVKEAIHKNRSARLIDDEPTNPLNQQDIFDDINTVLERHVGWQFNPDKARNLLEEIENETIAQESLMDILDFE